MTNNARFWVWVNYGWVKLTLKPNQVLRHYQAQLHDEGYSFAVNVWSHEGDVITRENTSGGRDCDGPISWWQKDFCLASELAATEDYEADHMVPNWQTGNSGQCDAYAEAAGY